MYVIQWTIHTIQLNAAECMSDISINTWLFYQLSRNGMYLVTTTICIIIINNNNMYTADSLLRQQPNSNGLVVNKMLCGIENRPGTRRNEWLEKLSRISWRIIPDWEDIKKEEEDNSSRYDDTKNKHYYIMKRAFALSYHEKGLRTFRSRFSSWPSPRTGTKNGWYIQHIICIIS